MLLQLISEGSAKLASVPSGGSGGGAAPAAGGASGGGAAEEAKEEEKEEGTTFENASNPAGSCILTVPQRRRSPTTIWDSVFSTNRFANTELCKSRKEYLEKICLPCLSGWNTLQTNLVGGRSGVLWFRATWL